MEFTNKELQEFASKQISFTMTTHLRRYGYGHEEMITREVYNSKSDKMTNMCSSIVHFNTSNAIEFFRTKLDSDHTKSNMKKYYNRYIDILTKLETKLKG